MRPATHPGKAERFSLTQRCVKLRKKADNASLGKLLDEHEGESRGLKTFGKGEAPAKEEEDSPAHLGLDQPPGDQGRGLLERALGVRAGPEVVGLGQNEQHQHYQDGWRGLENKT